MAIAVATNPALEQRRVALEAANQVRIARADWKRELKDMDPAEARMRVAEALVNEEPEIQSMLVATLLRCAPGVGPKKVPRLLFVAKVAAGFRVHHLSERQRVLLAGMLCRPIGTVEAVR